MFEQAGLLDLVCRLCEHRGSCACEWTRKAQRRSHLHISKAKAQWNVENLWLWHLPHSLEGSIILSWPCKVLQLHNTEV